MLLLVAAGVGRRPAPARPAVRARAGAPLFSIGVFSDLHYADVADRLSAVGVPRHYRGSLPQLRRAVRHFQRAQVDFVVDLGDVSAALFACLLHAESRPCPRPPLDPAAGASSTTPQTIDAHSCKLGAGDPAAGGSAPEAGAARAALRRVLDVLRPLAPRPVLHLLGNHPLNCLGREELNARLGAWAGLRAGLAGRG